MDRHGLRPRDDGTAARPRDDGEVARPRDDGEVVLPRDDSEVVRPRDDRAVIATITARHCEERSDAAIQEVRWHGSPRPAASR